MRLAMMVWTAAVAGLLSGCGGGSSASHTDGGGSPRADGGATKHADGGATGHRDGGHPPSADAGDASVGSRDADDAGCRAACKDAAPSIGPLALISTLSVSDEISVFTMVGGPYPKTSAGTPPPLAATELVAAGYTTSTLFEVDWSKQTLVHSESLEGVTRNWIRGIALVPDHFGSGVDEYLQGCDLNGTCWATFQGWPPSNGATEGPGQQDDEWSSLLVPGTTLLAVSSHFDGTHYGAVDLSDYAPPPDGGTPDGGVPATGVGFTSVLLDSTTHTYPFNLVATSKTLFAVGEEAAQIGSDGGFGPCTDCVALYGIDLASRSVTMKVPLGKKPRAPGLSPDGTTVYVPDFALNQIYVVDVPSKSVKAKYIVDDGPVWVAVTEDGTRLLVADWTSNGFQLLDASTGDVIQTVTTGTNPSQVALASDGTTVVVAEYLGQELRFYKLAP